MKKIYVIYNQDGFITNVSFDNEVAAKKFLETHKHCYYKTQNCYQSVEEYNVEINTSNYQLYLEQKIDFLTNGDNYAITIRGNEVKMSYKKINHLINSFKKGNYTIYVNGAAIQNKDYPKLLELKKEAEKNIKKAKAELEAYLAKNNNQELSK